MFEFGDLLANVLAGARLRQVLLLLRDLRSSNATGLRATRLRSTRGEECQQAQMRRVRSRLCRFVRMACIVVRAERSPSRRAECGGRSRHRQSCGS